MKVLITGSSGLIGSEAVKYFDGLGCEVIGIDNNMRALFFGTKGDTTPILNNLNLITKNFLHLNVDIRNRSEINNIFSYYLPDAIIHCAAQPSHDLARDIVFDDFEVNAVGTLNLLESSRANVPYSPFIFMSTNKVYGDKPNTFELIELEKRYDYKNKCDYIGISEECSIDQSKHSLFGASKLSADILTQEYGRYFDLQTASFRGGCLTGPNHCGVQLHGFLNYFIKSAINHIPYTIFGYKGKQVRDQIHSHDVVCAMHSFIQKPRIGEVYNLGGGRRSNASILELIDILRERFGIDFNPGYSTQSRSGDHICYISDVRKFQSHYPDWIPKYNLFSIIDEIINIESL
jgi:CDP-paratose 2-epimerase